LSDSQRHYPKSMNVLDFDKILVDPQKLTKFFGATLGNYILLWDQTLTGLTFDYMGIALAKASTLGFRVVNISAIHAPAGGILMYALIEKTLCLFGRKCENLSHRNGNFFYSSQRTILLIQISHCLLNYSRFCIVLVMGVDLICPSTS
jgi:hypothetical protein